MVKKKVSTRKTNAIRNILQTDIMDETDDIKEYRDGAKKVDAKRAKLLRHIAKEETQHRKWLRESLKTLK
jgi:Rubrerythrin.